MWACSKVCMSHLSVLRIYVRTLKKRSAIGLIYIYIYIYKERERERVCERERESV